MYPEKNYSLEKFKGTPYADKNQFQNQHQQNIVELKQENNRLKKLLKQAQTKRSMITKQCSQLSKTMERLQSENQQLKSTMTDKQQKNQAEKYRWEELRFLNKQLSSQIEELRSQNDQLTQKLRYSSQILQRKYEELQEKTYKRMEQCVKRVKKTIHYLQNLSIKDLEKTRQLLIDNLRKAIELLKGKSFEQFNCEGEIEELMNPLKQMQEQITQKTKELNSLKIQNSRLADEINKYRGIQKEQIPMFKEAIEKLKKNLVQVRGQLSQNQYEKLQLKKKYQQKLKQSEYKYNQIFKECRKIKLQKKIYENKLQELEADVEEEKERLQGQNQMLKKLYKNHGQSDSSRVSKISDYKHTINWKDKKTQQKRALVKNYSTNELRTSAAHIKNDTNQQDQAVQRRGEISDYNEESSMVSQENLKQQICRIDEQIMEIQKNLTKELQAYH